MVFADQNKKPSEPKRMPLADKNATGFPGRSGSGPDGRAAGVWAGWAAPRMWEPCLTSVCDMKAAGPYKFIVFGDFDVTNHINLYGLLTSMSPSPMDL